MKPVLAASVLILALSSAACTADGKTAGTPPTPKPDSSSADVALSQDTKAICDQADRTSESFGNTLIADLKLQLDAKGKDPAAKQKLTRDVANYSYALGDMSKLAGDPTLKTTLKQMSDQVTGFSGDLTKLNATKLSELSDSLDKACGKG